jgi:hypothetical protein
MNRGGLVASGTWLQIDIARAGTELQVTARSSQGQEPSPHRLGALLPPEALLQFGEGVKAAASTGKPLKPLSQAQALYEALFQQELRDVLGQLRGAAGGEPLLLRLNPSERDLHAVPWEALCRPGTTLDFLGTSPELCLARGASSTKPWAPCRVEGPVRLLVISPSDEHAPERLRAVLHPSIEAGELEWLTPLTGAHASKAYVLQRLRYKPVPHILHFIGHGGLDAEGHPTLRLADRDGEESWLKVELLAKELEAPFRDTLRLVVLEACEGARPGTLSSAAALLAQHGAGAVVAHLWPVRADVARRCSVSFYRSLAGTSAHPGDVARSLHDARRTVLADFDESAEAFSPVLYLRGPDAGLFSFEGRQLRPPRPATASAAPDASVKPVADALRALLQQPCSLLLGDHWAHTVEAFRQTLHDELRETSRAVHEALPLSALTQRYALQFGEDALSDRFQTAFQEAEPSLPLVEAVAKRLGPGVHMTLLRSPALEEALVRQQPGRPLYVLQPSRSGDRSVLTLQHVQGQGWVKLKKPPESVDPQRDTVLLRLYRGYLPNRVLGPPMLTEDDFLQGVRDLESLLPPTLAMPIQSTLARRPALLLGLSLVSWDHRHLLHTLFRRRPLPEGSTVLCEPGDSEAKAWQLGRGLPGGVEGGGLRLLQASFEGLSEHLGAGEAQGTP